MFLGGNANMPIYEYGCPECGENSIRQLIGNVMIGDDVIIGAGSVVTKDIPSGVTVKGNPAK